MNRWIALVSLIVSGILSAVASAADKPHWMWEIPARKPRQCEVVGQTFA